MPDVNPAPAQPPVQPAAAQPRAQPAAGAAIRIEPLLEKVVQTNASDLHLQVGVPPALRIDGTLRAIENQPAMTPETTKALAFSLLDQAQRDIFIRDKEFDFSFAFGDMARFRVNVFHERGNVAAALRLIPNVIRSVEELGLPVVINKFADYPRGLVLVTGPTGSGKSSTLAAILDKINTEKALHIITVEDPIEYTHKSKQSLVVQREIHYDTFNFANSLRSALRQDPDVVLVGEMRDLETIASAITIAETGHLVFATLHTNSASQSIDRMIDVFPSHQQPQVRIQLASILQGVCAQRLVPAIGGGRIPVTEVMFVNSAIRAIVREGKSHHIDAVIQTSAKDGMITMDRALTQAIHNGLITYEDAREYAVNQEELDRLVRG